MFRSFKLCEYSSVWPRFAFGARSMATAALVWATHKTGEPNTTKQGARTVETGALLRSAHGRDKYTVRHTRRENMSHRHLAASRPEMRVKGEAFK